jgi:hypothetical protein
LVNHQEYEGNLAINGLNGWEIDGKGFRNQEDTVEANQDIRTSISTHGALVRLCKQQLEFRPVVPPEDLAMCRIITKFTSREGIGSNNHGHMTENIVW